VQVKPTHGLSDDEVELMIRESFQFAAEDVKARQVIEARTEANGIIAATEKALARGRALIRDREIQGIERVLQQLREAKESGDHRQIRVGYLRSGKDHAPFG
jgi:molecular chaperone DnaK